MLRNSKDIEGCTIGALDGQIGTVSDVYFDDEAWVARYLVVITGSWLTNRKVLISPAAVGRAHPMNGVLAASITQEQVRNSPDIDTEKPVSRQHELRFLEYYRYPPYWGSLGVWAPGSSPGLMPGAAAYERSAQRYTKPPQEQEQVCAGYEENGDPHLRSCNTVMKYHIHAKEGDIGRVQGLLIDEETWAIRYLIADTSNWWLGHQVLIAPQWIDSVSWPESKVYVDLTRQALQQAPAYDATMPLDRTSEIALFEYYGRTAYWKEPQKTP